MQTTSTLRDERPVIPADRSIFGEPVGVTSVNIDDIQPALDLFVGGTARLWGYSPSHDRLTIQLYTVGRAQCQFLTLLGCTDIQIPTMWAIRELRVNVMDDGYALVGNEVCVRFAWEAQMSDTYEG